MRKFVPLTVILGLAIGSVLSAAAIRDWDRDYPVQKKEETTKTLRFADSSRPGRVVVDNIFGFIHVEGYDGRDVELALVKTVFARNDTRLQAALAEVQLDITEKADTVDLYVDGPFRDHDHGIRERRDPGYIVRYDFTLRVPRRVDLDLATVTDGDVLVRGVEGDFAVHNVNGRVRLDGVAGSGEAETVNGEVGVVFRRAPGSDCSFKTLNGDVTLAFPGVPSADFRLKTMHGEIYTDFDTTPLAPLPPTTERREGKFVYRANRYSGVRTGQGGPEVRCETMTGDILIRREK